MPTTRSQAKQTHIEDFTKDEKPVKNEAPKKSKARPATSSETSPPSKRQKTVSLSPPAKKSMSKQAAALMQGKNKDAIPDTTSSGGDSDSIMINRAPVLDLWATTVTQFLYPNLSWDTCLSAGSAISALCAVSKGRSIGVIEPSDKQNKKKPKKEDDDDLEELEVMGFNLKLENKLVVVGGKTKPANEDAQKKKFGESQYAKVKSAFEEALQSWKGSENELNKHAFGFYENFRPSVAQGQKGWGRKGELNLETIKNVVQKKD